MATPVKDGQLLAPFVYCVEVSECVVAVRINLSATIVNGDVGVLGAVARMFT